MNNELRIHSRRDIIISSVWFDSTNFPVIPSFHVGALSYYKLFIWSYVPSEYRKYEAEEWFVPHKYSLLIQMPWGQKSQIPLHGK